MHAIADTERLQADGIITAEQAKVIETRAREALVSIAINSILCFGIVAATAGLVFWLANAVAVAVFGAAALAGGLLILARAGEVYRMFGNAAALIGSGMLMGGGVIELIDKYEDIAGWTMSLAGAGVAGFAGWRYWHGALTARFVCGSIILMGVAMHLGGIAFLIFKTEPEGLYLSFVYFYAALIIAAAGWLTDVRFVTALAIVPFAQMLDTGTFYLHALYAFYSPEPTISILQMAVLIAACVWAARRWQERQARHARVISILAFVVANLCALVASLWGDVVGESLWGPGWYYDTDLTWEEFDAQSDAFRETALVISDNVYSVLWALALVAMIVWAAHRSNRGLFNTAMTFAAIHAYTQLFESFGDEPLAYVIGGLAAIPLAWGMWRLNAWISGRSEDAPPGSSV